MAERGAAGRVSTVARSATEADAPAQRPALFALGLLAIALALGAFLRFAHLRRPNLSADEGATWAAASEPTANEVVARGHQLDPGKLPLYDLLLHGWMRGFGEGEVAMRAMSAALGTLAIVLLFAAVRESCRSLCADPGAIDGNLAGALAALIYAVSFMTVASDRTLRMYPLEVTAELAQIVCLVRAVRRPGWLDYAGTAVFTAVMIAANFTASFLLFGEALWFGGLLIARLVWPHKDELSIFRPGLSVIAGIAMLSPWLPAAFASSRGAIAVGALDWIKMQPPWWPGVVLCAAAGGTSLFLGFVALALIGIWRYWGSAPAALGFFAAWTLGPFLGVMAVSYLIRPLEFPRYALIGCIGMYAFAGFGAAALRTRARALNTGLPIAIAAAVIWLSFASTQRKLRHPYEADWRGAARFAVETAAPDDVIAVYPAFCKNVLRYYVPPARRSSVIGLSACGSARVLVLTGRDIVSEDRISAMETCYPRLVRRLMLVEVRTR